jgi:predicted MPP superfamily phosphohydrolase
MARNGGFSFHRRFFFMFSPSKISRRKFLSTLSLAGGGMGVTAYGRWVEPEWLEVTHTQIPFFHTPPPRALRILLLSDFHYSPGVPLELIQKSIELGLEENPDRVLLAGDFVTERLFDPVPYGKLLRGLAERVPCLACLGNHDGDVHAATRKRPANQAPVRKFLKESGIPLLDNESLAASHLGLPYEIIGLGDLWSYHSRPKQAFPDSDTGAPRLVLCHNPDTKKLLTAYR